MRAIQILVSAHEKRAHPFEHGHFDSTVEYTIEILPDDNVTVIVDDLQAEARSRVVLECNVWVDKINKDREDDIPF